MQAGWITLADIASKDWSPRLGQLGGVVTHIDDIDQAITVIVTTPKGTDFFRPTFGSDWWQLLDQPITNVTPAIIAALAESIQIWEPRVQFNSASVRPYLEVQPDGSDLLIELSWTLRVSEPVNPSQLQQVQTTVISVAVGGLVS